MKFPLIIVLVFHLSRVFAQCNSDYDLLRLEINPDFYWDEVSWTITDFQSQFVYGAGTVSDSSLQFFEYCVLKTGCFKFQIEDAQGDGIAPDGYYALYLNDTLLFTGNPGFGESESQVFGCPPGIYCTSAIPVDTGAFVADQIDTESWYAFTPTSSGLYQFETCSDSNACPSKIWIYEGCDNLLLTEGIPGALFFGDTGCANGVDISSALLGNKTYFIRLRYADVFCDGTPLHFGIHYVGAISGCTDPLACNYNPLATIAEQCLYAGNPNCPLSADLTIDQDYLRQSLYLSDYDNIDACAVAEGCVRGTGLRYLVNFSTKIKNIGISDFFLGQTPANPTIPSNQFFWDACHNHWHYRGYAEYILYDELGTKIPIGTKNGFCVLDLGCQPGIDSKYTCINMGITAGCEDVYSANTPCQWIDITGLPAGKYNLVNRVNWDRSPDALGRYEYSYTNNWALACFELTYTGSTPSVEFLTDCTAFVDCTGEIYGDAQPDCEGICNGTALMGDWNQDTLRNQTDVEAYLNTALVTNQNINSCRELTNDTGIDVYDAAVLQECSLYGSNAQHWGLRKPCTFPTSFDNSLDDVFLSVGKLDTTAKWVELEMINPITPQIGYQCSISGLVIDSIENLAPNFHPNLKFNPLTNEIIGLSADSSAINKSVSKKPFLRIYYSTSTASMICLDTIRAIVNAKYQKSNGIFGTPLCVPFITTGIEQPNTFAFQATASPNPSKGQVQPLFPKSGF